MVAAAAAAAVAAVAAVAVAAAVVNMAKEYIKLLLDRSETP